MVSSPSSICSTDTTVLLLATKSSSLVVRKSANMCQSVDRFSKCGFFTFVIYAENAYFCPLWGGFGGLTPKCSRILSKFPKRTYVAGNTRLMNRSSGGRSRNVTLVRNEKSKKIERRKIKRNLRDVKSHMCSDHPLSHQSCHGWYRT